jgi:hypothetical protein
MQLLYNSESFAVLQFELPPGTGSGTDTAAPTLAGFEIVDKFARREVFLQGALAERFRAGVQSLAESGPTQDQFDDFIAGFTAAAPHPVVLH